MEFLKMFISEYGTALLYLVVTGVFAYLGTQAKALADKYLNNKIKKDVAKTVVQAVQQIYKDVEGQEKFELALEALSEMLAEKGITITELEMKMLIEAAVCEFKDSFKSSGEADVYEGEVAE